MGRRGPVKPREIEPDPVYHHYLVSKLINKVMRDGKKSVAQKHVYRAFEIIKKKTKEKPLDVFLKAVEEVKPRMEVRSRRVGGAAYQVPVLVRGRRQESLALRWLIEAARKRPNASYHHFSEKLAAEIIDAYKREGGAINKKEEIEKLAEANTAFAHLRW